MNCARQQRTRVRAGAAVGHGAPCCAPGRRRTSTERRIVAAARSLTRRAAMPYPGASGRVSRWRCATAAASVRERAFELGEDARDVDARRLLGDEQRRADLAVPRALGEQGEDLALARASARTGRSSAGGSGRRVAAAPARAARGRRAPRPPRAASSAPILTAAACAARALSAAPRGPRPAACTSAWRQRIRAAGSGRPTASHAAAASRVRVGIGPARRAPGLGAGAGQQRALDRPARGGRGRDPGEQVVRAAHGGRRGLRVAEVARPLGGVRLDRHARRRERRPADHVVAAVPDPVEAVVDGGAGGRPGRPRGAAARRCRSRAARSSAAR